MKKVLFVIAYLLIVGPIMAQDVIDAQGAAAINANAPRFHFVKSNIHDFGILTAGDTVKYDFEFVNAGKEPLSIVNIGTSCGCTIPAWTKKPILPGEKGVITIQYNSQGQHGSFNKEISIQSNAVTEGDFEMLYIKGIVADTGQ